MKKDLISIIIVNWNGKKWLQKCISSLLNQTHNNIEIILVDNASSDDSVEFVKKNYKSVRILVNKGNLGFSKACRVGVDSSKGEYIAFVNSDTWVDKDFIGKLYDYYKKKKYDVISPKEKNYDKSVILDKYCPVDFMGNTPYGFRIETDKLFTLSGPCWLFRKDFYLETKGLDEDFFLYFEDVDWFWRLQLLGKKFAIVSDVFIYHSGAGSLPYKGLNYKVFLWRNKNNLQMLLKNYSIISLVLILPIYLIQNLVEIIVFTLILKPKLAYSYIQGWMFNLRNFKRTLSKRKWIQENRVVGDLVILRNMYPFPMRLIGAILRLKKQ